VRLVDDALRLLVAAGVGLLVALLAQAAISMIALHENVIDALYFSTRSVATVAEAPNAASASGWFKLFSALDTVAAPVLVAVVTAALVRRLSGPRLTLLGPRRAPARGHLLLVGLGQVGFRLAQELRRRDVPVVAVERAATLHAFGLRWPRASRWRSDGATIVGRLNYLASVAAR